MKKLFFVLELLALMVGCAQRAPFSIDFDFDGGDSNGDTDTDADDAGGDSGDDAGDIDAGTDTDTETEQVCSLNVLETFDDATLPINWTIEDLGEAGYTWAHSVVDNSTGGSGGYWWVDASVSTIIFDDWLITDSYQQGLCSGVGLLFKHNFHHYDFDFGHLDIKVDAGVWQEIATYTTDSVGLIDIDITPFLSGDSSFEIRFRYTGHQDHYWKIDDFTLLGSL